jgi:hypothetical protein
MSAGSSAAVAEAAGLAEETGGLTGDCDTGAEPGDRVVRLAAVVADAAEGTAACGRTRPLLAAAKPTRSKATKPMAVITATLWFI